MTDKEKVIKGLEHCAFGVSDTCYEKECPYYQSHGCTDELKNDILALLKEQEAVVRCKDCKHRYNGWCYDKKSNRINFGVYVEDDWFCADGEKW